MDRKRAPEKRIDRGRAVRAAKRGEARAGERVGGSVTESPRAGARVGTVMYTQPRNFELGKANMV